MTPAQASAFLAANRSDEPRPYALCTPEFYALVGADLAKHVAAKAITRMDRTELTALLRSVEQPLMPAHVEARIQDAISKGINKIRGIEPSKIRSVEP